MSLYDKIITKIAIKSVIITHMSEIHDKIKNKTIVEKDLILTHEVNKCKALILKKCAPIYDDLIEVCQLKSSIHRYKWAGVLSGEELIYADRLSAEYDDFVDFLKENNSDSNDMDFGLSMLEEELKFRIRRDVGELKYYNVCKAIGLTMYI